MKRHLLLAIALLLALGGCQGGKKAAYLGRWSGSYVVDSVDPKLPIHDPARNTLRGFVQIYLTDDDSTNIPGASRCAMHLEGEQESVDLPKGNWIMRGRQIVLRFEQIKINDAGGFALRDPNKAFIPPAALKEVFSQVIALNVSADKKALSSGLIQMGPLSGHFEFKKDSPGH